MQAYLDSTGSTDAKPGAVVVTGIGTVSPLGTGKDALLASLRDFKGRAPGALGVEARDFDPRRFVPPMVLRRLDRASALAVAAGILARDDALLDVRAAPSRTGVVVGTGGAGIETTCAFFRVVAGQGPMAANPMLFPSTVPNAPAGQLAIAIGATGPQTTFAEKAIPGENAIAFGASLLGTGRADAILAGGVDELSQPLHHGYLRYGAISRAGRARPFDLRRDGLVLGEGATFLVLEGAEAAARRGARIYARLEGLGQSSAPVRPGSYPDDPAPVARNLALALERASLSPGEIGWVNSSANGSRALDELEARALAATFTRRVPVSSLKGSIGDAMAGGALRAAVSCLAIAHGFLPGTAGLEEPDPALPLDRIELLPEGPSRDDRIRAVLQTGLGDGGAMLSLVFRSA